MSRRKAEAKQAAKPEESVLSFLRNCAKPVHWQSPSPPRARKTQSPDAAQEQALAVVTNEQAFLYKTKQEEALLQVAEKDPRVQALLEAGDESDSSDSAREEKRPKKTGKKAKAKAGKGKDDLWNYVWEQVDTPIPTRAPLAEGVHPLSSPTPCPQPLSSPHKGGLRPLSSPPACMQPLSSPQTGGKSSEMQIVPYVRRRLVGKQPPVLSLAIEVYRGRRLNGKQPAPILAERKTVSVRGHYDVLGVLRTASATEIHAAYRRRALATHPDKGGDPKDFHRVKIAFEELSDLERRTNYDRNLVLFGRRDGMASDTATKATAAPKAPVVAPAKSADRVFYGAARVALFSLMASNWTTWLGYLTKMQDGVLNNLRDILKGAKTLVAPADQDTAAGGLGNVQGWQGPTCITQQKSGYKVTVSWAELSICTGFTKSLTQSIDWQIALLSMQGAAQVRMKRRDRSESKDPLTENELLQVLEREPGLELVFSITVNEGGKKGKKVTTPGVMDLKLAMDFRRKLLAATHGRNSAAAVKAEKRNADQEAAKEKRKRRICEQQLLIAVNQELQARRAGRSRGTGDQSSKALVLHQASRQDSVKHTTPDAKGKWIADQSKSSPCKVSKKRNRTQVEAPVKKQRV